MKPISLPRLEVEPLVDRVVRLAGGRRVDELIGSNPTFENADYYFELDRVIAELKILEKDDSTDKKMQSKVRDLYTRWAYEGRVPPPPLSGTFTISVADLPEDLRLEFIKPFRSSLQGPVKKASRQIKQTKSAFQMSDSLGLLILVNDGNLVFTPAVAFNILHHLLKADHSSINHVIFCTVNLPVMFDNLELQGPFWSSAPVEGRSEIPEPFRAKLSRCWTSVLDETYGLRIPTLKFPNHHAFDLASVKFDASAESRRKTFYVEQGQFYRSKCLGHHYYCDGVDDGTAHLYLVESYQDGKLIQANFDQKIIWSDDYELITDPAECCRLQRLLRQLKKSEKSALSGTG